MQLLTESDTITAVLSAVERWQHDEGATSSGLELLRELGHNITHVAIPGTWSQHQFVDEAVIAKREMINAGTLKLALGALIAHPKHATILKTVYRMIAAPGEFYLLWECVAEHSFSHPDILEALRQGLNAYAGKSEQQSQSLAILHSLLWNKACLAEVLRTQYAAVVVGVLQSLPKDQKECQLVVIAGSQFLHRVNASADSCLQFQDMIPLVLGWMRLFPSCTSLHQHACGLLRTFLLPEENAVREVMMEETGLVEFILGRLQAIARPPLDHQSRGFCIWKHYIDFLTCFVDCEAHVDLMVQRGVVKSTVLVLKGLMQKEEMESMDQGEDLFCRDISEYLNSGVDLIISFLLHLTDFTEEVCRPMVSAGLVKWLPTYFEESQQLLRVLIACEETSMEASLSAIIEGRLLSIFHFIYADELLPAQRTRAQRLRNLQAQICRATVVELREVEGLLGAVRSLLKV